MVLAIVLQNVPNKCKPKTLSETRSGFSPYNALNGVLLILKCNQMPLITPDKFFVYGQLLIVQLGISHLMLLFHSYAQLYSFRTVQKVLKTVVLRIA